MARLPYVSDDGAGPAELVAAIRARRGGVLLNLDRMLLHSPALARGWSAHLGAVRSGLGLAPRLRELVICAVARLNGADYEFEQHLPMFLQAGGAPAAAEALTDVVAAAGNTLHFDAAERAALRLTLEMTREVKVGEATFTAMRDALGDPQQLVELVGVIATYNMVSRFLVALGIDAEGERRG
jgi:alkylhydroperoxidase family enzyme